MTDQKGSDTTSPTAAPIEQGAAATPAVAKKAPAKKAGTAKTTAKPRTTKKATTEDSPAASKKTPAKSRTAKAGASSKEAPAKGRTVKTVSEASVDAGTATSPAKSAPAKKAPARKAAPKSAEKNTAAQKTTKASSETSTEEAVATPRTEAHTGSESTGNASQASVADTPKAKSAPKKATGTRAAAAKKTTAPKGAAQKTVAAPTEEAPASVQAPRDVSSASAVAPEVLTDTESSSPASAGRGRAPSSRGRGRGRPSKVDAQATTPDTTEAAGSPAEFPTSFDSFSPEQAVATGDAQTGDGSQDENNPNGDKKRRGRSRRGRGRRKNQEQATAQDAITAAIDEAADDERFDDDDDQTDQQDKVDTSPQKNTRRKMFVSVLPGEQVEVVLTEEGQVQEYYVEMLHQAKTKGNIYKATIHNVDPNLQAAFVSYGATKNGFLQIDEIHPEYYNVPHDGKGRKYPPIQKVLKNGQELLVQVVKEPAGTKGAFLTTYLSLPGRFLVLTPGREQIGVSRKVENEAERSRLRQLLEGLNPGNGLGVIVRTVSMGASKTNLQNDLQYLQRAWREVRTRGTEEEAPTLIYQEMDLTTRAIRDYLTDEIVEVWLDDEETATSIAEVAEALFPRKSNLVRVHKDATTSLFERFNLQRQLDQIQSREVVLPSGGRLVIDPTEALTAIDINSGRSGGKNNFEDMAYRTNLEAAKMIPLQLRLRDIGGQVVVDFIEMRDRSHWRELEKTLRNGMKVDRARYDVGKISSFGMMEIVRQRLGSSAISISTEPCPYCTGTGVRRNIEWQSQQALREILRALKAAQAQNQTEVVYEAEPALAMHLLNNKRQRLLEMEQSHSITLEISIKHAEVL